MKTCNRCFIEKDSSKFQTVNIKGVKYKRLYCIPCKGKQDYQSKLKRLHRENSVNVGLCDGCGIYFRNKAQLAKCIACRNELGEISYINQNGNKRYFSDIQS